MMIHVLLIVFIDVACLYFADFNMIVNMFVVGKCLEVQWREFWFNVFWLIFFHNSVYKYQHGVFFGTASCARFCILWCRFLLMLIMLIVLIWVPFCWIYVSWCMLWTNAVFFFNSRFVQFSSILLDKVEAFAIAFSISSVLFSVRLVSVSNHFCNFVEVQLHITGSLILSSVSLPHSQCKANSHSPVTKCLIHYLNFCSALWNAERSKGYLL